ncbi:MAG TPA: hypothetical protein VMV10_24365 [Pirellulales bacterium]|nr:hypothetical protein [Pirellulales bacterium]
MPVSVRCQHCGQRYSVREDLLGKQIKCKACGQVMAIVAEAAATNAAGPKPASKLAPAAAKPAAARAAPAASAGKPPAAMPAKQRAPAAAGHIPAARAAVAKPQQTATAQPPAAADPLGATAPANDPLFGPSNNLLDLLGDVSLPAAGAAPLGSGVVLKSAKPAAASKPAAKKTKKKKGSSGASMQTQTIMRMLGGVCVILFGLGAFGIAIAYVVSEDENGFKGWRAIRWTIFGISLIGSGLKLIVG